MTHKTSSFVTTFLRNWLINLLFSPPVQIHVLPGGKMPERKSSGAIGHDCYLRAVVSPNEMDSNHPVFRKNLFDFSNMPDDPEVARHIKRRDDGELVYVMDPGESVLVGIGFATAMDFPMFYWVTPRSGLSSKFGITVTNAPGTVDPDYRGEAGVLVYNRNNHPFELEHNFRICQVIFSWAIIPSFIFVGNHEELGSSERGTGGFGSTGLKG